jgi:microcystin-dependent protein
MPAHSHAPQCNTTVPSTTASPKGAYWGDATSVGAIYAPSVTSGVNLNAASVASQGGGQAHNNLAPFVVANYIICLIGIYPTAN